MAEIRARCHCGEVDLSPTDIRLSLDPQGKRSFYVFRCPQCRTVVQRPAFKSLVKDLLDVGVVAEEQSVRPDLPPLTYDELIDFHEEVQAWDGVMR